MAEHRSLYDRHPDDRVDLEPSARRVLAGFVAFYPDRVEWQIDEDEDV